MGDGDKMRDSKRITRILNKIKKEWEKHPDWRFYQLLGNSGMLGQYRDRFFNIEDDELEHYLDVGLAKFKEEMKEVNKEI